MKLLKCAEICNSMPKICNYKQTDRLYAILHFYIRNMQDNMSEYAGRTVTLAVTWPVPDFQLPPQQPGRPCSLASL